MKENIEQTATRLMKKFSDLQPLEISREAYLIQQAKAEVARGIFEEILYVTEDYFTLSFGEFRGKYEIEKAKLPGGELKQVIQSLKDKWLKEAA